MAAEKVEVDAMSDSPTDFWNSEKEKRTSDLKRSAVELDKNRCSNLRID